MSRIDVRTKPLARQPRRWTAGGSEGVTGRAKARTCLKIVGFNPMRDRSFRDVRQAHQPAAPAHDRRHDGAPIQGEGAERLRPARQELHGLLGRSPATATSEDLRRYQLHLAKQQISPGSINAAIAALRFFFTVMLERPDLVRPLTIVNKPRKAPVVLSEEEVARLLEAAPNLKYKAALSVAYGAGLRVSEVANLKVSDIDSQRMTLRVEQGKGQRDRYVMLAPQLLELLREWWLAARLQAWLFPGRNPINPMSARQLVRAVHAAAQAGGHRQASLAAHLGAQLRHPSARAERRHPRDPGPARPRQAGDDRALHPRRLQPDPRHQNPARAAGPQPHQPILARLTDAAWRGLPSCDGPQSVCFPRPGEVFCSPMKPMEPLCTIDFGALVTLTIRPKILTCSN